MADLESAAQLEAEQQEYLRVLSRRVAEELAKRVDVEAFADADDEELDSMIAVLLLLLLNEAGPEMRASAEAIARAGGSAAPTDEQFEAAVTSAAAETVAVFRRDLMEQRDAVRRAVDAAERHGSSAEAVVTPSFSASITGALAVILAGAAAQWAGDVRTTTNVLAAVATEPTADDVLAFITGLERRGGFPPDGPPALPAVVHPLVWLTMHDESVCDEPSGAGESPSGIPLPDGALTSCEGRHGVALPRSDWGALGFPRDARLLCSRYQRPRCRCMVFPAHAAVPERPVVTDQARKRGHAAAEAEQLDVQDAHVRSAQELALAGELRPSSIVWLSVRVSRRRP